ncbi:hypothetical protein DDB_G0291642 [Dictyostelium discoideum AX4]|uniref:Uncharacterized protein n=1 Tax=Dictyostelium discoideum TaxID=44689 RepID=Q54EE3_DICDI|nr:hypothetical protein DDB_G0291642 [Dictyostelium discoideum AX4]EAL61805.1 hypothetical protein DDB_G0291642 [Dictyostelium discoideum AX4]|eukprot:XP_635297.1 hypothetical protein DDB_G0291642 [Dictyostelium discoideum AX4]
MNSLKSLETVNVRCSYDNEYSFKNSVWVLTYLNKLNNKDIIINFELDLACFKPYQPKILEHIEREEFKFKTNLFEVEYDYEEGTSYGFVYEMIKELNPKYLKITPFSSSDAGESHLRQYHSISKLNQNYESVEILGDFIPLYALYRFLQSPNLHTLEFDLQFHFISSIYDNSKFGGDKTEFDFNKMDNFNFRNFINFQGDTIGDGINEDDQIYCSFSDQDNSCIEIPPYSMSLWNQCLKLLSTNSTITNLSITHNCGGECGWDKNSLFNENFLNDFMNSLANNKTIKNLTLDFTLSYYDAETDIINLKKSITSMLDQNTTLESIVIFPTSEFKEISNLTKNTKCKIFT